MTLLTAKDFNPPLYYYILHFWMKIFGSSEIALRSLSFVFYWATLYVVFLILQEVLKFNQRKSFAYLVLFAINPLLLYYGFEARMYTLLCFFATLSFYALYKKNSKLYLLAAILGLYTHYFMILVVIAQYFLKNFKQKTAFLAFAPWALFVIVEKGLSGGSFWIPAPSIFSAIDFVGNIFTGYENSFGFFDHYLIILSLFIWVMLIFAYKKYATAHKKEREIFKTFLVWGVIIPIVVVIISFIKPVFLPRYLIFSGVGLTFLIILAVEKMSKPLKIVSLLCIVSVLLVYQGMQVTFRLKSPIKNNLLEIKSLLKKDDVVYVTNDLDFFVAQYYIGEKNVYIYGNRLSAIPNYIGTVLINKNNIAASLPIYPKRAFIVTNDNGDYEVQSYSNR